MSAERITPREPPASPDGWPHQDVPPGNEAAGKRDGPHAASKSEERMVQLERTLPAIEAENAELKRALDAATLRARELGRALEFERRRRDAFAAALRATTQSARSFAWWLMWPFHVLPRIIDSKWQELRSPPPRRGQSAQEPDLSALAAQIALPSPPEPDVSVIIPAFGKVKYTFRCLISITRHAPQAAIEVIVLEDASGDPDVQYLRSVANLRLVENEYNLGFVRNCNLGAQIAKGRYIHFLNNDTEVTAGWLDQLIAVFHSRADAGIVGSKLLYPNGTLLEAGGIVWRNASTSNFGGGDNPQRPAYNYLRETDYVSGASLLIERALFQALGGFSEIYDPAYCEDVDLAFKVRAAGRKVYYQPRSVIVHSEGVSHGKDVTGGISSVFRPLNQARVLERWGKVLIAEHAPPGEDMFKAREHGILAKSALVIEHLPPQAQRDSGLPATMLLMRLLIAAGYRVKFLPHDLIIEAARRQALEDIGVEMICEIGSTRRGVDRWFRRNGRFLDMVLLIGDASARSLSTVRRHTAARVIYYGTQEGGRDKEQLQRLWREADCVICRSEEEAAPVRASAPRTEVAIVPATLCEALDGSRPCTTARAVETLFDDPSRQAAREQLLRAIASQPDHRSSG